MAVYQSFNYNELKCVCIHLYSIKIGHIDRELWVKIVLAPCKPDSDYTDLIIHPSTAPN